MADDRSVDVDEPMGEQPVPEPRPPIVAAHSRLTPMQQAYSQYTGHATRCDRCRSTDGACKTAEELWLAYQARQQEAFRQFGAETA